MASPDKDTPPVREKKPLPWQLMIMLIALGASLLLLVLKAIGVI